MSISDQNGTIDSFSFNIPVQIPLRLECPKDTVISCSQYIEPLVFGIPNTSGADTVFYEDEVLMDCPEDLVINRSWIAIGPTGTDTCIQQITVLADGLTNIDYESSIIISGVCIEDVHNVQLPNIDGMCNVQLDSVDLQVNFSDCDMAELTRTVTFTDICRDSSISIQQNILINDLPIAQVNNESIIADFGNREGSIDLDIESCSDSLSLFWSNGDTTEDISRLNQGDYFLILNNELGCADTLNFIIPFVDTNEFNIIIQDRDSMLIDVDSIRTKRGNGGNIVSTVTQIDQGQYSFSTAQTLIRGDQICFDIKADAATSLSVLDVIKAQRHVLGIEIACEEDQLAGDINFSGNISGADLAAMQRVILSIDSTFASDRTWIFLSEDTPNATMISQGCVEIKDENLLSRSINVRAIKLGDFKCD